MAWVRKEDAGIMLHNTALCWLDLTDWASLSGVPLKVGGSFTTLGLGASFSALPYPAALAWLAPLPLS